jgi:hypothetical protein
MLFVAFRCFSLRSCPHSLHSQACQYLCLQLALEAPAPHGISTHLRRPEVGLHPSAACHHRRRDSMLSCSGPSTFRVTLIVKHSALSLLEVCQSRIIAIAVQDVPLEISFAKPLPFVDGRSGLMVAVVRRLAMHGH